MRDLIYRRRLLAAAIIGTFTTFAPYLVAAEGFHPRNIFEFTALSYSTGSGWMRVENAVLFPVSQSLTPGIHVAFTNSADERRYRVQPGLVWVIGGGFYSELIYGLSANEVGTWMQEWSAELTHESARTLESARLRSSYNHASGNLSLSPDAAFRYNFTPRYSAKLQYFFGYESTPTWVHSLKIENTFQPTGDFAGTMILIGTKNYSASGEQTLWSAGAQMQTLIANRLTLKYVGIYHWLSWGFALENSLTLDWSF
jgi:hypothetical protein